MSSIISIKNVSKNFGDIAALKNVNLEIKPQRIVGLLGPNGSGKTTLIKILAGLIKNYQGNVLIDGKELGVETKAITAYLPDINFIPEDWTTQHALEYFTDFFSDFNLEKANFLLEKLEIRK